MNALINAAGLTVLSTAITLVVGMARTKLMALTLGVSGVGLVGQVHTALGFATTLTSVGFTNALVRCTASAHSVGQPQRVSVLLATSYLSSLTIAMLLVACVLLAPQHVSDSIFGPGTPTIVLVVIAVALPLMAIEDLEGAVTQGLKSVRHLAIATSVTAILALVLLGPLVLALGVNGALLHIAMASMLAYVFSVWVRHRACRQEGFGVSAITAPSLPALRSLLSYGSANFVVGSGYTGSLLFARALIVNDLGIEQNGIYQVLWSVPSQALSVVFGVLSTYCFPLISGLRDQDEIVDAINTALRFALMAATPLITMLVLLGGPAIVTLYSAEFLPAAAYLPAQLLGDFFKVVAWALGLSLLGRGHLAAFTVLGLAWNAVFAGGVLLLVPQLGLWGAVASYVAAYGLYAAATYIFQHWREGFRLTGAGTRLLACSGGVMLGAVVVAADGDPAYQLLYTVVGLPLWVLLGTSRNEREEAWRRAQLRCALFTASRRTRVAPE
jgi:O-antigen/teichoic acid export membrane protein